MFYLTKKSISQLYSNRLGKAERMECNFWVPTVDSLIILINVLLLVGCLVPFRNVSIVLYLVGPYLYQRYKHLPRRRAKRLKVTKVVKRTSLRTRCTLHLLNPMVPSPHHFLMHLLSPSRRTLRRCGVQWKM